MSRADAAPGILDAAIALGTREGVAALTLQGIASERAVSKALVLYHHQDKDRLLIAIAERLVARDVAALGAAATDADVLEAWRRVGGDAERREERALLAALLQERPVQAVAPALTGARAQAAAPLAQALLSTAGLRTRIAVSLLGRVMLHQLDGIAVSTRGRERERVDAELDAAALALMGLGA